MGKKFLQNGIRLVVLGFFQNRKIADANQIQVVTLRIQHAPESLHTRKAILQRWPRSGFFSRIRIHGSIIQHYGSDPDPGRELITDPGWELITDPGWELITDPPGPCPEHWL